jgi:dihydroxy-acid dehydratase
MNTKKTIPVLPSRATVEGLERAPHRAFLHALGLSDADLAKPFVGVASTDGRVTPCNALLGGFARQACAAVREAGGVPFDFASVSVADSMSMGHGGMRYSLLSRELIADGVEAVARGHAYDALVTFAGCDKTLPGMMMAMARLNLPSVFVYGGAALPGQWQGRDVTVLDSYEAVGAVLAGTMKESELTQIEHLCIPTLGSCAGQFTANTMAMVSETLGLAIPGSATMPAVASERSELARAAGKLVMDEQDERGQGGGVRKLHGLLLLLAPLLLCPPTP